MFNTCLNRFMFFNNFKKVCNKCLKKFNNFLKFFNKKLKGKIRYENFSNLENALKKVFMTLKNMENEQELRNLWEEFKKTSPSKEEVEEFMYSNDKLHKLGWEYLDSSGKLDRKTVFSIMINCKGVRFMKKNNIPTAAYGTFDSENIEDGYAFLDTMNSPYVLKADGLAAGKGVLIIN